MSNFNIPPSDGGTPGGTPGGSSGSIQWNNGGVFAGLGNTDGTNVQIFGNAQANTLSTTLGVAASPVYISQVEPFASGSGTLPVGSTFYYCISQNAGGGITTPSNIGFSTVTPENDTLRVDFGTTFAPYGYDQDFTIYRASSPTGPWFALSPSPQTFPPVNSFYDDGSYTWVATTLPTVSTAKILTINGSIIGGTAPIIVTSVYGSAFLNSNTNYGFGIDADSNTAMSGAYVSIYSNGQRGYFQDILYKKIGNPDSGEAGIEVAGEVGNFSALGPNSASINSPVGLVQLQTNVNSIFLDGSGGFNYDIIYTVGGMASHDFVGGGITMSGNQFIDSLGNITAADLVVSGVIKSSVDASISADTDNRILSDISNANSIDWDNRVLIDGPGITSVNYGTRYLVDPNGDAKINWGGNTYQLTIDAGSTVTDGALRLNCDNSFPVAGNIAAFAYDNANKFQFTGDARIVMANGPTSDYGTSDLWKDGAFNSLANYFGSLKQNLSGPIFAQTESVTVVNSTAETTLIGAGNGTATLPGFYLNAVGKTLRITARGYFSAAASPNITIAFKHGTTVLATTGAVASRNDTDQGFQVSVDCVCRAAGASGSLMSQGLFMEFGGTNTPHTWKMGGTAPVSINLENAGSLSLTAKWSAASTSNSITVTNLLIEAIN